MNVNFYLSHPRYITTSLYLLINHKGNKYTYFTDIKVNSDKWKKGGYKRNPAFYSKIKKLESEAVHVLECLLQEGRATGNNFKKDMQLIQKPQGDAIDLISYIEKHIEKIQVSESTKRTYRYILKAFENYQRLKNRRYTLLDIDREWVREFVDHKNKKGRTPNTIKNEVDFLMTVMNEAEYEGLAKKVNLKSVKVKRENFRNIYLTNDEITAMYNLNVKR